MSKQITQHMERTGKGANDPVTFADLITFAVDTDATADKPAVKKTPKK